MTLNIKHNTTRKEYTFSLTELNIYRNFYQFSIELGQNMDDGEYTYNLFDNGNKVIATGLLQIGDYTPEKIIYDGKQQSFITYKGGLN